MRWLVEAADSKTGMETEITVEARTEAEAERLARYNGLLVWKVSRVGARPAPLVPYRGPEVAGPPQYVQVLRSAAWVRRLSVVVSAVGWIGFVTALGVFSFLCMREAWDNWKSWRAWLLPATVATWRWAAAAAGCVIAGAVMRLMGAVALAIRDVARNTYRPEAVGGLGKEVDSAAQAPHDAASGNGATAVVPAA